ncbi:DUF1850 domain-containing protein [Pseudothermotoga thermarum]|uniref:DUF1850 domain-containing protein n=1 Tax=Pseudothermotoga thermarum DSM 5069 TaxID=688269 RepID=F7YV32_9THEM|nr:DUF1850 domain-containing protein [Pseudothermotoga thermarum]AEH50323.1 Domain of unknown function DUF1850 [Pseudothermotoga thermarum DSM 5069]
MWLFIKAVLIVISFLPTDAQVVPILQILKGQRVVWAKAIFDGKFTMTYVHSVEKTPVYEFYKIDRDGYLHLYEARYSSYGAGLPSEPEEGFRIENNQLVLKITRKFEKIPLRVSHLDGHGILFKDGVIMFKDIAKENELIILRAVVLKIPKCLSKGE